MADETASAAEETVKTDVLYIRDNVLEWPDRVVSLRHIQSVSCAACESPERPVSAGRKKRERTQRKNIGIVLCAVSALILAAVILFFLERVREPGRLAETSRLTEGALLAGIALPAAAGAYLIRTGRTMGAEAEVEMEKWKAACAEAEQSRHLEIVLSSGERLRFQIGNPVFLQRVFQLLSSKLEKREDPDGRYKIELDTCKLYRIKQVHGGGEHRRA